jgi:hypothetical protein
MPTPKPPYPAEFRQQMVELVHAGQRRQSIITACWKQAELW